MPVLPSDDRSLIHGLADFWASFFKDVNFTEAYFKAGQIQLGQLYLELMQTVLGASLNDLPLFSKYYYRLFTIREDQVAFEEGATSADDRYVYAPEEHVVGVDLLMNKVVAPTATAEAGRDFDVAEGAIKFRAHPVGAAGFPVRAVQGVGPSLTNPRGAAWSGVRGGDEVQFFFPVGAAPHRVRVKAVDGVRLMLDRWLPEFDADLRRTRFVVVVTRTPADTHQLAVPAPSPAQAYEHVAATLVTGFAQVTLTAPTALAPAVGRFVYVVDRAEPRNTGYSRVTGVSLPTLTLAAAPFLPSAGPVDVYLVDHGATPPVDHPVFRLPHAMLDRGSVRAQGRRLVAVTLGATTYPAGENVVEDVDYSVDYVNGEVRYLSLWDPLSAHTFEYTWQHTVQTEMFRATGAFSSATTYAAGETATNAGALYVARHAVAAGNPFDLNDWAPYAAPFAEEDVFQLRETAYWGADVLVDRETLFTTYGYLVGHKKPTSEQYRAFVKGVCQLYMLGPSLRRFESALNVTAGFPVVRDDGEVLRGYDDGYLAIAGAAKDGDGGELIDTAYGRDGVLNAGASTFASATMRLFASDVGALIRVRTSTGTTDYAVTAVSADGHTATVAPSPPANADYVVWSVEHTLLRRTFRVASSTVTHIFSDDDIDGVVVVAAAGEPKNVGAFRIVAVAGPREVVLETPYGFIDEANLAWRLSRTRQQVVTTSRAIYTLPLRTPVLPLLADPAQYGVHVFAAFDALTTVVRVVDSIEDPTWWHRVTIPKELASFINDAPGRRRVTPDLIPHVVDALDQAVIDDFGVRVGLDDEGVAPTPRRGNATWTGGGWLRLDFLPLDPSLPRSAARRRAVRHDRRRRVRRQLPGAGGRRGDERRAPRPLSAAAALPADAAAGRGRGAADDDLPPHGRVRAHGPVPQVPRHPGQDRHERCRERRLPRRGRGHRPRSQARVRLRVHRTRDDVQRHHDDDRGAVDRLGAALPRRRARHEQRLHGRDDRARGRVPPHRQRHDHDGRGVRTADPQPRAVRAVRARPLPRVVLPLLRRHERRAPPRRGRELQPGPRHRRRDRARRRRRDRDGAPRHRGPARPPGHRPVVDRRRDLARRDAVVRPRTRRPRRRHRGRRSGGVRARRPSDRNRYFLASARDSYRFTL
jgi:hypothetical protein